MNNIYVLSIDPKWPGIKSTQPISLGLMSRVVMMGLMPSVIMVCFFHRKMMMYQQQAFASTIVWIFPTRYWTILWCWGFQQACWSYPKSLMKMVFPMIQQCHNPMMMMIVFMTKIVPLRSPKTKTNFFFHLQGGKCSFVSFDIETCGEHWRLYRCQPRFLFSAWNKHTIHQNFKEDLFNEYVQPQIELFGVRMQQTFMVYHLTLRTSVTHQNLLSIIVFTQRKKPFSLHTMVIVVIWNYSRNKPKVLIQLWIFHGRWNSSWIWSMLSRTAKVVICILRRPSWNYETSSQFIGLCIERSCLEPTTAWTMQKPRLVFLEALYFWFYW